MNNFNCINLKVKKTILHLQSNSDRDVHPKADHSVRFRLSEKLISESPSSIRYLVTIDDLVHNHCAARVMSRVDDDPICFVRFRCRPVFQCTGRVRGIATKAISVIATYRRLSEMSQSCRTKRKNLLYAFLPSGSSSMARRRSWQPDKTTSSTLKFVVCDARHPIWG